jgi:hypothetical protein
MCLWSWIRDRATTLLAGIGPRTLDGQFGVRDRFPEALPSLLEGATKTKAGAAASE